MIESKEMCYDCGVNPADPTILGYYEVCKECYDVVVKTLKEYKANRTYRSPEMDQIFTNLYLGNQDASTDYKLLESQCISAVLVCGTQLQCPFQDKLNYKVLKIADDPRQEIINLFPETFAWIEQQFGEGRNVIVHCAAGVSRSATVVIAYLIRKHQWVFDEAFSFVKSKRSLISPNSGFIAALKTYQQQLKQKQE